MWFFMFLKARPTPNYWFHSCGQCHGTGQIDWIQKIVKRENITPVGHILEDFYFKETGNLVRDNREELKMLSYCYSNVKVVKKD